MFTVCTKICAEISSNVDSSLRSRHHSEPSGFTHSVGSSTFSMTPEASILYNSGAWISGV